MKKVSIRITFSQLVEDGSYDASNVFLLTVPDNLSDIDMQNILKKEYGKNGIYKNGYCPESLIKYICEKYEWEYCDFPFDFDLYFK